MMAEDFYLDPTREGFRPHSGPFFCAVTKPSRERRGGYTFAFYPDHVGSRRPYMTRTENLRPFTLFDILRWALGMAFRPRAAD